MLVRPDFFWQFFNKIYHFVCFIIKKASILAY
jgi:hypothetical protein